jgi:hypothetical protein
MYNWNTFGAWTNHAQTQTHKIHKTHHGPNLKEGTTLPFIIFFVAGHGASTQMSFCPETPKSKSQNSLNWDFHNFGGS